MTQGWRALGARARRFLLGGEAASLMPMYLGALAIAWPAALEGMLISVISSIDTMMVGTISPAAIAAVGLTSQPRMVMLIMVQAVHVGTTAIVARRRGAGDERGYRSCLEQSMYISLLLGLFITAVGFFLAAPIMRLAGANDDTLGMSVSYFQIIALGFIPNSLQLCVCAAFRGLGKTKVTMVTHMISNVVNLVFNYLLIGGNFGFPRLGVRGAAIATLLGGVAAMGAALWFATRGDSPFRYRVRRPAFDRVTLSGLWQVGASSALEAFFLRAGFFVTNLIIANLGTAQFAAYHIVSQVSMLSFTLGDGISAAGVAMVGQSLGAGNEERAKRSVFVVRRISVYASVALMLLMFFFRRDLADLFTDDLVVIGAATAGLLVVIPSLIPQNARVVYAGCLRGAGDVRYVAYTSFVGVTVLRPLLTWLFCFPLAPLFPALYLQATGPWFSFLLDAFVRSKLLADRVKSGRWTKTELR
ncbi:MAG TPA: MATE family efflux transporter [Candidatus Limnocylindria bacterium]|nr:MATE family efflux transporter [Candidatus Limnocylindria bacterium]